MLQETRFIDVVNSVIASSDKRKDRSLQPELRIFVLNQVVKGEDRKHRRCRRKMAGLPFESG